MRYAIVFCLALLLGLPAHAATVDFRLTLQPGTTDWVLDVSTDVSISAVALEASTSLNSFQPSPGLPLSPCCVIFVPVQSGRNLLRLDPEGSALLVPAFQSHVLLGTFAGSTSSAALVELVGAEESSGFTVLDGEGNGVADYSITLVPEPAAALLVFAALALAARRLTDP